MPHRPELREALLFSPSSREARKFARMRQAHWRFDWPLRCDSVLSTGLAMLALQRPEMALRTSPLQAVKAALAPLELPQRVVEQSVERFGAWRSAPRISVFGADAAPSAFVGARLAKLVAGLPGWTLVTGCHRRTSWQVHDWALQQYVPVDYHGTPARRPGRALASALILASDRVVVFEQRRQKRFDHLLQLAKVLKRRTALELYDADGGAHSPLGID